MEYEINERTIKSTDRFEMTKQMDVTLALAVNRVSPTVGSWDTSKIPQANPTMTHCTACSTPYLNRSNIINCHCWLIDGA